MTFSPLRRVGAVICVLMLVAAACGSDSDDAASPAPATTAATATTAAPAAAAATTAAPAADAADAATAASFECGTGGDLQEASLLLPFPFAVPFFSVFVADSLGYFEEAGLDVSIEFTDGSSAVVQQVVAGSVDFGMSDPGPIIDATALGESLKVPYVFQTGLIYGLVTEDGSPYTSISDFVGETVAVSEATAGEVPFFEALLSSNGVDPEADVQIVETGAGATTAAAFSSGRIVAYFSDYFNLIELGFEVALHSFDLGDFALLHAASVVATDETISEDPNLVACLSRAMARATEFTHANPTGALVAIASKYPDQVGDFSDTGFDMLALNETIVRTKAYPGSSGQWGWNRPASWDHYVDLLSARGALSGDVDSNSLYTNDFIEFANDFDKNAEHAAADALAASLETPAAASDLKEASLRLSWSTLVYDMPFFYALEQGFYADEGIDLEIGEGEGSGTTTQLVGAKNDTFGWADSGTMMLTRSNGAALKNVLVVWRDAGYGTACFNDVGFSEPKDLEGRSVIFIPQESTASIWPAYLDANGVDESKVTVKSADWSNKMTLFAAGEADCMAGYVTQDTLISKLMNPEEIADARPWSSDGIELLGHGIIAHEDTLAEDPELVAGFVRATIRGWQEVCADPQIGIDMYLEKFPDISEADVEWTNRNMFMECDRTHPVGSDPGRALSATNTSQWAAMQDTLNEYGGLENVTDPNDYFTNDFVPGD